MPRRAARILMLPLLALGGCKSVGCCDGKPVEPAALEVPGEKISYSYRGVRKDVFVVRAPTGTVDPPVVVILHGSEASSFTRAGYQSNRALVDKAALLDAYQLIDVRMCETWMNANGVQLDEIPAFIDVIPFAPEEIRKLEAEGYLPYDSVNI